ELSDFTGSCRQNRNPYFHGRLYCSAKALRKIEDCDIGSHRVASLPCSASNRGPKIISAGRLVPTKPLFSFPVSYRTQTRQAPGRFKDRKYAFLRTNKPKWRSLIVAVKRCHQNFRIPRSCSCSRSPTSWRTEIGISKIGSLRLPSEARHRPPPNPVRQRMTNRLGNV